MRVLSVAPVAPPIVGRVPPIAALPLSYTPLLLDTDAQTQRAVHEAHAQVAQLACEALRERGLHAQERTRHGEAGPEIVIEAQEWPADLIIVGSRDRSAIKRLLLGSTATHVVQHAHCSVEVARATDAH